MPVPRKVYRGELLKTRAHLAVLLEDDMKITRRALGTSKKRVIAKIRGCEGLIRKRERAGLAKEGSRRAGTKHGLNKKMEENVETLHGTPAQRWRRFREIMEGERKKGDL
ncbi:MAG: hypothetical protein V1676_00205 [Candidatus Diapherotrites archaeon]